MKSLQCFTQILTVSYFLLIVSQIECISNSTAAPPLPKINTLVLDGEVNKTDKQTVDATVEYIYQYSLNTSLFGDDIQNGDIRIHVKVDEGADADFANFPVMFVVRQQQSILSWQLPQLSKFGDEKTYYKASRTLCSEVNSTNGDQIIYVTVSTQSSFGISFTIKVTVEQNFTLELGQIHTTSVSTTSPRFFRFIFPENSITYSQYVLLEVTSEEDFPCMTVSVQNCSCPIFDDESNVQFEGYWQTMTRKAGMTIRKHDFPNGFFVVFVVHTEDTRCENTELRPLYHTTHREPQRKKELEFKIIEKISYMEYVIAIVGTIGIFLAFYVFSIVISCAYFWKKPEDLEFPVDNGYPPLYPSYSAQGVFGPANSDNNPQSSSTTAAAIPHSTNELPHHSRSRIYRPDRSEGEDALQSTQCFGDSISDSSLDETDIDLLEDAHSCKDIYRTTTSLYLTSLARKNPRVLAKKSQLYLWTLFTVAVFYSLPVIQLVFTYQQVLHTTGNQDLCYYNYLCSHPLWILSDFNHVYSNVGYIMLGILFIFLVYRKQRMHQSLMAQNAAGFESYFGIPCHFGLFYAIGASLFMEGVLSGCYHVCPNGSNFQFDTSFMYVIAVMCMLKIYQTRHPDINASAYMAFASLAFIILIGVLGVMAGSIYFMICFTALHVGVCFYLSIQIYYLGRWRLDSGLFRRIYGTWKNDCLASPLTCLKPLYWDRMILLTLANFANWGIAAMGIYKVSSDFASHLLVIFMANLFIYIMFYIIMKLTHREKILWQSYVYIILSFVFWGLALAVFIHGSTSWSASPAQSRALNRECILLRFYDTHDIWHFLSAASMFFSFMVLLTLDDGLINTPRHKIAVF